MAPRVGIRITESRRPDLEINFYVDTRTDRSLNFISNREIRHALLSSGLKTGAHLGVYAFKL